MTELTVAERGFAKAFDVAGITVADLDLAEVHDCLAVTELLIDEAMGLASKGEAGQFAQYDSTGHNRWLPVNMSGWLKAKGRPVC